MTDRKKHDLSRREFISVSAVGVIGTGLSTIPLISSGCATSKTSTVHGACYHDCPDRCSWTIRTKNGEIEEFAASADNPYTAGTLCDKMVQFPDDVTFHHDRVLTPLKRVGLKGEGEFEPISWDLALEEIGNRLKQATAEHGGKTILPYSFGGNQGRVQSAAGNRFFARIGASQLDRTICGNTVVSGVMATNGQTTGVLPMDIVHSRHIILWGTNPALSNQHLWRLIQTARETGARIVVVDPFKSRTAQEADEHIQLMPGTDTALALGLMHVILSKGLQDDDYIARYTSGVEQLTEHLKDYDPDTVARITGLTPSAIEALAVEYATSSPSVIRLLIGIEHQANGGSASQAIAMLPALTGAWRLHGGGLMNMTYELAGESLNWQELTLPSSIAEMSTRTINMIELGRALTDPAVDPPINALFVYNSNPAVTTPNQNLVVRGLEREDLLTVVLEHFVTDTARYADYIFPATTCLENWDILTSWGSPYLNINEPAIEPLGKAKPNSEFFRLLSRQMGFTDSYLYNTDIDIVKSTLDSNHPYLAGITFESLRKAGWARFNLPDPWIPHQDGNFNTPSGKCLLYNPNLEFPLPTYRPVSYSEEYLSSYPLHLLTVKSPSQFLNSSHANITRLRKREGSPWLDIHSEDARERNLNNGDPVRVYNERGSVLVEVRINDKVRTGVVCMPQGFWSSLVKGTSTANALTSDRLTDMGGGGALQEVKVQVEKSA